MQQQTEMVTDNLKTNLITAHCENCLSRSKCTVERKSVFLAVFTRSICENANKPFHITLVILKIDFREILLFSIDFLEKIYYNINR